MVNFPDNYRRYCGYSYLRYCDFSTFLLLETPGFLELRRLHPLDALQCSALVSPQTPIWQGQWPLHVVLDPTDFWWWWWGGRSHEIFTDKETTFLLLPRGIKNLTESFIPFPPPPPPPRELKNDSSLKSSSWPSDCTGNQLTKSFTDSYFEFVSYSKTSILHGCLKNLALDR